MVEMSYNLAQMQTARQAEKQAVETERLLYHELMLHLADCEGRDDFGEKNQLLVKWKAALQERLELSFVCTNLAKSALA
ncbi:MAG: hypothetical protein JWR60_1878 [Polaromonas sp.]|nr:hypothetical protein [Polaromonas sp.]